MLSATGSDWVPMGSDVVRLGPMGSDWVISHTAGLLRCHPALGHRRPLYGITESSVPVNLPVFQLIN